MLPERAGAVDVGALLNETGATRLSSRSIARAAPSSRRPCSGTTSSTGSKPTTAPCSSADGGPDIGSLAAEVDGRRDALEDQRRDRAWATTSVVDPGEELMFTGIVIEQGTVQQGARQRRPPTRDRGPHVAQGAARRRLGRRQRRLPHRDVHGLAGVSRSRRWRRPWHARRSAESRKGLGRQPRAAGASERPAGRSSRAGPRRRDRHAWSVSRTTRDAAGCGSKRRATCCATWSPRARSPSTVSR